jgi:hypothetical protein
MSCDDCGGCGGGFEDYEDDCGADDTITKEQYLKTRKKPVRANIWA